MDPALTHLTVSQAIALEFLAVFSRLEFALKVTGFRHPGDGEARAHWIAFAAEVAGAFDPGRTEEIREAFEYLAGQPLRRLAAENGTLGWFPLADRAWKYGLSAVYFNDGRVTTWRISPLNPLKARMLPSGPTASHPAFFTIGSTKDEVLAIQGTPTEFTDRAWKYGLSSVFFENDHVTRWRVSPLNPLKARLLSVKE